MKYTKNPINPRNIDEPWYKDPQIIVTIIVGVVSAIATIAAALI